LSKASLELIKNAGPGAKLVFDGVFGTKASGAKGPSVTDADVERFFSLIPNDIDTAKAQAILAKTEPYKTGSIADLLTGLQAAAAGELSSVPTDASADPGVGGGTSSSVGDKKPASEAAKDLAATAAKGNFTGMIEGARRFQTFRYTPKDLVAGNTLTVTLISILGGKHCAGVASLSIREVTGGDPNVIDKAQTFTVKGSYVYSSEFVDENQNVVAPRNFLVGKNADTTINSTPAPPDKPAKKPTK
jgi:hypothetical protein